MSSQCPECSNELGYNNYCDPCNSGHWRNNFQNWTSGDDNIDKLIRESQLNARNIYELLEWIEYSNLNNIEHLAEGGFGSVYKAIWKDGPIGSSEFSIGPYWNIEKSKWIRRGKFEVAVKKHRNVTSMSSEFLNEVNKAKAINTNYDLIYFNFILLFRSKVT